MTHRLLPAGTTLLSMLFLYGCGSSAVDLGWLDSGEPDEAMEVAPVEESPAPVEAPTAEAEITAPTADEVWQSALDAGMSAARLAQNAISPQDWELVSSRWERAIKTLEAIPENAPNHAEAQAKLEQYRQNQRVAQQHYQNLTADRPAAAAAQPGTATAAQPAPTAGQTAQPSPQGAQPVATSAQPQQTAAANALCQGVQANSAGAPIEVANIRFYRPPATPYDFGNSGFQASAEEDYMIGCLINNSDQAIGSIDIEFTSNMPGGVGFSSGSVDVPVEVIQPGAAVPFRGPFGIDPDTTEIVIEKLAGFDNSYDPIGTAEPQLTIAYSPSPAAPAPQSADQLCAGIRPTKGDQAFEVNRLQLYVPPIDPYDFGGEQINYLVGCITNHSGQPLSNLAMAYGGGAYGGGGATVNVPGDEVPPGATVPFRKYGDVEADQASITVQTISSNAGEIEVGVTVTP